MSVTLGALWLPIIVAAVAVWFWAFLSWAILPVHKKDFGAVPDEEGFLAAIKQFNIPPGNYGFPYCADNKQRNDPAFTEKWKTGPAGLINIWVPNPNMGMNMLLSFVVYLIVSFFIAYIGWATSMQRGLPFAKVFQVAGVAGILAYTFSFLPQMIWFQASKNAKVSGIIDGIVSGLLTGLVFAMLWPK
jgi:hypothetical protein